LAYVLACRLGAKKQENIFEPWLEVEERFGFRSTFFFFPDQASIYHPFDGPFYRYQDQVVFNGRGIPVVQLMRELESRGWEIGLHGTFESFSDPAELRRQKEQLESGLQSRVVSIRQHCLHFDIRHTPRSQTQAGFKYDTTFGFNRTLGFRNGLALPFHHYDLEADAPLTLLEIPLQVQDGALFRKDNLDLAPEEALVRARELISKVEQTGGLVTLLWHPRAVEGSYSGWFWVYQELLADIAARDAWVGTVREIGGWWQQRRQHFEEIRHADH
jgi:peptidoglycan/xylan/chitin deacetylase (PgdA/CDA1 family)